MYKQLIKYMYIYKIIGIDVIELKQVAVYLKINLNVEIRRKVIIF